MTLALTSFSPSGGPTTGGTKVVIVGTGLDTVDDVLFGSVPGSIDTTAVNTATLLTVIAPPISNLGTLVVKIVLVDNGVPSIVDSAASYTYTTVTLPVLATTLNSKWGMDVDTSVAQDGSAYTPVRGRTNFQPLNDPTTVDDSDFDSGAYGSDVSTQLKWSLVCTVDRKVAAGFVEDPGQAALRLTAAGVGQSNVARVRWYDRNGSTEAYEGFGLVKWAEKGGTTADKSSVDVTIMGRGARTTITNPV